MPHFFFVLVFLCWFLGIVRYRGIRCLFLSISVCLSATRLSQTKRNLAQKGNDVWVLRDFILVQKNPKILETCERVACVPIMWNIKESRRVGCSRGKGSPMDLPWLIATYYSHGLLDGLLFSLSLSLSYLCII